MGRAITFFGGRNAFLRRTVFANTLDLMTKKMYRSAWGAGGVVGGEGGRCLGFSSSPGLVKLHKRYHYLVAEKTDYLVAEETDYKNVSTKRERHFVVPKG